MMPGTVPHGPSILFIYFLPPESCQQLRDWFGPKSQPSSGTDNALAPENTLNFGCHGTILLDKLPLPEYRSYLEEIVSKYLGRVRTLVCLPFHLEDFLEIQCSFILTYANFQAFSHLSYLEEV